MFSWVLLAGDMAVTWRRLMALFISGTVICYPMFDRDCAQHVTVVLLLEEGYFTIQSGTTILCLRSQAPLENS